MMNEKDKFYLEDVLKSILSIEQFLIAESESSFYASPLIHLATVKTLENIGEAVKGISQELKSKHAEINWKDPVAMRDILIHDYLGTNLEIVWETITKDFTHFERTDQKATQLLFVNIP